MSRRLILSVLLALAVLPVGSARAARPGTWNLGEQHRVRQAGLMHFLGDERFHGERPLAGRQLPGALKGLADRLAVAAVGAPTRPVSVIGFDRLLVTQLGAADVAATVQAQARAAGLRPPSYFGTEVVARFLGLRDNHPDERLELYPWEAITRAEAAHSLAVALEETSAAPSGAADWARSAFARFVLPRYTPAQRKVLSLAVAKIGMPYIWGGETDAASSYFGGQIHGGYDCSGFAWRVFKLSGFSWGAAIRGRTAAMQAAEIPRSGHIRLADVRPADLLFFGPGRFWQRATERRIVHEGIALSSDWMIHASAQGVYVSPLFDPWRAREFSWARRVL
jgi:cell wall-associated NlpC family hydrolase